MKKSMFRLGAILLAGFLSTQAEARTIFEGRMVFTAVSNCVDSTVGDRFTSLYHISGLNGNSSRTSLTMVRDLSAEGYQIDGVSKFTTAFKTVNAIETGTGAHAFQAAVRIISSTPATATATTNSLSITGQIKNRKDDPNRLNCIVTFRASYTRRID
jgi:hypothetical protein